VSATLPPTRLRFVSVRGNRLRVSVRGEGRPLLLVMGIGASLDLWSTFEQEMVLRGYQVICFDLPGAGGSPALVPPRRMGGLAKLAIGLLDELGYAQVDVLGVSFGGIVAQEIARRAPTRVRRLVLCATGPGLGGPPGKVSALRHMVTARRYRSPEYAGRIAAELYGGRARIDPTMHASMTGRFMRPPSVYGYLTQLYAISGWSSTPWLCRLAMPTLVLTGDDDPIVRTLNGRILATLIRNARLVVIKGGGHLFLLDQTVLAADLVDGFLTEHGPLASGEATHRDPEGEPP
jgi:poly(3-hydroxyalkanoate) depolymerase